jgi:hypothetical protein
MEQNRNLMGRFARAAEKLHKENEKYSYDFETVGVFRDKGEVIMEIIDTIPRKINCYVREGIDMPEGMREVLSAAREQGYKIYFYVNQ